MRNVSDSFHDVRQLVIYAAQAESPMPGASLFSAYGHHQHSQPKISFYANSWLCTKNVRSNRGGPPTRFVWRWFGSPAGLIGGQHLRIVKPETFTRWHRQGFRLFWRWKSQPGRPALPKDLRALIRRMALENPTWGQERIANELLLKLGLRVSPRTVRKYMPSHCVGSPGKRCQSQRWSTFIRNHAKGILACDFCVAITATFRMLYVFVIIEHASRRLLHVNVTAHPTARVDHAAVPRSDSSRSPLSHLDP